ncbi:maleylpyruvate isomerase family mycothiol-dependent enzyme [Streptomyces catenulae]|uniref:Maleylpyruvate isomerase family mycothiol-dependent enzyme n=1 Tax=Streptomyces catenulae TaxID=66875 RepID=A0ABV2Z0N5_9ACTN|nr:maleylpyruvate isomerase family mycothiol-dependent enzyme [Streptomyces catenulae]
MSTPEFARRCTEITRQTAELRKLVEAADALTPVPGCPGWHLGQLVRHVGGAHRWVEEIIRTRATREVPDDLVNAVAPRRAEDLAALGAWLDEGAARLVEQLHAAGPDARVWTVLPDETSPAFWARRMAGETLVHRADAALAVGAEFTATDEAARDAVDEWLSFCDHPEAHAPLPDSPAVLGPGRTLAFDTTTATPDAADGALSPGGPPPAPARWFIDLTGDTPVLHRTAAPAAVTVRATPTALLLFLYGRPLPDGALGVTGDRELLARWRDRAAFWLT